jgi:hypothetical protein
MKELDQLIVIETYVDDQMWICTLEKYWMFKCYEVAYGTWIIFFTISGFQFSKTGLCGTKLKCISLEHLQTSSEPYPSYKREINAY